ncbi:MAG: tRNA pseudouridine(55) synthase TruB [Arenimonas sp.]
MKRERPVRPKTVFRRVDGLLLLDKPAGISSNQALQRARHLFRAEKGGHTGSLDPLATGLLPLCFGEATKIAGYLLGNRKAYETLARFGTVTDTDDADGQTLVTRPVPLIESGLIHDATRQLIGRIRQRPPIYSALKQGGEPLYAKARRGETIEVPEREVEVESIEVLEVQADAVRLRVACGSGTYVRSLVRDLGETLGCGAHVAELRRLWVDPFREPRMVTIEQIEAAASLGDAALDELLLPVAAGLAGWPEVHLDARQAHKLGQGQGIDLDADAMGQVHVLDAEGRSLGLGEIDAGGMLRPRRLFVWASAQG